MAYKDVFVASVQEADRALAMPQLEQQARDWFGTRFNLAFAGDIQVEMNWDGVRARRTYSITVL